MSCSSLAMVAADSSSTGCLVEEDRFVPGETLSRQDRPHDTLRGDDGRRRRGEEVEGEKRRRGRGQDGRKETVRSRGERIAVRTALDSGHANDQHCRARGRDQSSGRGEREGQQRHGCDRARREKGEARRLEKQRAAARQRGSVELMLESVGPPAWFSSRAWSQSAMRSAEGGHYVLAALVALLRVAICYFCRCAGHRRWASDEDVQRAADGV